jgi:hypothetical protein
MAHTRHAEGYEQEASSGDDDLDIVSATRKNLKVERYIKSR